MRSESNGRANGKAAVHEIPLEPGGDNFTRTADRQDLPGTRKLAVCPSCQVLHPAVERECPGCGATAVAETPGESAGNSETGSTNGSIRKVEERPRPKPQRNRSKGRARPVNGAPDKARNGGSVEEKPRKKPSLDKESTAKIVTADADKKSGSEESTGKASVRERLSGVKLSRRGRIIAGALVAVGLAAGAYVFLINDPEAEVARKALDSSRPATVKVVTGGSNAINMTEAVKVGQDAGGAQRAIGDQSAKVAALEDQEYRTVVGEDLAAQRALVAPYAAIGEVNPKRVSSRKLKALSRGIRQAGSRAPARLAESQAAVEEIGALAPEGSRPIVTSGRLDASTRRMTGMLNGAAATIGAWEQRVEIWRRQQAEKKAALAAYTENTRSAMNQYQAMRSELDELDGPELDAMPMSDAETALQDHRNRRLEVLDQLMAVQPPASVAGTHDQLEESVRQGADGLDSAISAMSDQGNLTYATDLYTGEDYLFGDYFRDEPEWQSYQSTSEMNSERMSRLLPQWEQEVEAEKKRLDAAKPPKRPVI